jgi:hypothetical protein
MLAWMAMWQERNLTVYSNHSISSFSYFVLRLVARQHDHPGAWFRANGWLAWNLQVILLFLFLMLFAIIILHAFKKKIRGFNPYLFLACTIGACVIPPYSYDYKLSILPPVFVLVLPGILSFNNDANRFRTIVLAFLFSLAYSSTLYSFANKPALLQYNFPALFVIMVCTVVACLTSGSTQSPSKRSETGVPDELGRIEDAPSSSTSMIHE